ncbi:hypothetical protein CK203_064542 [Vitis vinifera]|uniref:Putative plant transposon protein domain-containing protein n=1 Tax=Vitis vinifera TaxID=29760 RepID=A0A438G865_VITVI|nr:hypothetical protein CK203_064542 [Vitis vinifera]
MSKPQIWLLVSFFPSPRVFVPEKNPSSVLFAVVWFVLAVVTRNLCRAQLSFSFMSAVGISVYFGIRSSFSCGITDLISSPSKDCRSGSPSRHSVSRVYRLVFLPFVLLPPSIPKAPAKTSIDGIPFNAFPAKFCRDQYTKVYRQRSLVLERQLHLESFLDTPIPDLFVELGWLPLANFTKSACVPIVRMFYSNIIEHDLDESYLQSSLFGIVVKVTPKIIAEVLGIPLVQAPSLGSGVHTGSLSRPAWVLATFLSFSVYPSSHRANICKNGCILLSRILHREPINLASCILDEMIFRGDPTVSKKEIKGALGSKKKVCHSRAKRKFGESDADSDEDSSVLAHFVLGIVVPRIAKGGDCECLARLAIPDKIPKCPLTQLSYSYSDYLTLKTKTLLRGREEAEIELGVDSKCAPKGEAENEATSQVFREGLVGLS